MLWLGGGCGAGKTTVARTLALRFDLACHRIDAHSYKHRDRLGRIDTRGHDERWLTPTPEQLAEEFVAGATRQLPLILDDLQPISALAIVEGPQLFPSLIESYVDGSEHALWLVPTVDFARVALRGRGDAARLTSDENRARENRLQRDVLLSQRCRDEATVRGWTVWDIDGSIDLPTTIDRAADHFSAAIATGPRLATGAERRQRRRTENDDMLGNFRSFIADAGIADPGPVPFVCECTSLGCEVIVQLTPAEHDTIRANPTPWVLGH